MENGSEMHCKRSSTSEQENDRGGSGSFAKEENDDFSEKLVTDPNLSYLKPVSCCWIVFTVSLDEVCCNYSQLVHVHLHPLGHRPYPVQCFCKRRHAHTDCYLYNLLFHQCKFSIFLRSDG